MEISFLSPAGACTLPMPRNSLLPLHYFMSWTVHLAIAYKVACSVLGRENCMHSCNYMGGGGERRAPYCSPALWQTALQSRTAETGSEEMDPEDAGEVAAELQGKKMDGWNILQIATGTGLTAYIVWAGILMPGFRKVPLKLQVPYIPASAQQVQNVMRLFKGRSGKMVDLGSGDGRIVLEAYKQGFRPAVGYELNPWLLHLSSYRAWKAGCYGKVSYYKEDLWKVNLSDCQNVTVFLAPSVLMLLEKKLLMELPEEARVVAGRFPLPNWTYTDTAGEGVNQAWAYDVKTIRQLKKDELEGSPV